MALLEERYRRKSPLNCWKHPLHPSKGTRAEEEYSPPAMSPGSGGMLLLPGPRYPLMNSAKSIQEIWGIKKVE